MATKYVNLDRETPMLLPPDVRDWVAANDLAKGGGKGGNRHPFGLKISLNGTTETGAPDSVFPQKFDAFSSIA
jgi:hypothetical protein